VLPHAERPTDHMAKERLAATAPGVLQLGLNDLEARFGHLDDPMDYLRLIGHLRTPANLAGNATYPANWDDDEVFGWHRLAGPNPMTLERPNDARWALLQPKLGLTDHHVQKVLGEGATIDGARREGLLAVADYPTLDGLPCGVNKHLVAPCGAFVWHPTRHALLPAALRMGQSQAAPLFTPDASDRWGAARGQFANADFVFHEMAVHLSLVHFLQEGMAVALQRSLPPQHPVHALLTPHFKYLLFNNFAGRELLVEPGGYVEVILSTELAGGSMEVVRQAYTSFHFDDLDVPRALAARGMMSKTGMPQFPYRDDGLVLWSAIDTWTRAYVAAYYRDDRTVSSDPELSRWCREMTSADAAHVRGFPEHFEGRDALATALTRIIFLASAQHAAVNYPQHHSMLVVPNMPGASFSAQPHRLHDVLPPLATAHTQVEAIWLLTCYQYGKLGVYGSAMNDPKIVGALNAFHKHLDDAEKLIHTRNIEERRGREYSYLKPSRVPNSSNI